MRRAPAVTPVTRERAGEIAGALDLAGDGWAEVLARVPEYDPAFTALTRERIARRRPVTEDAAWLLDGTLLIREDPDGRWAAHLPGDWPPVTLGNMLRVGRAVFADERERGNQRPWLSILSDIAWSIRRGGRR